MGRITLPKTFERRRRLAWQRHRAQALFRGEGYEITEEYWNEIWTEERFNRRGMQADDLCLTRRDHSKPWGPGNLGLMARHFQLEINNKVIHDIDAEHLYENAVWSDYV